MSKLVIVSNDQARLHTVENGEQIGVPVSCKSKEVNGESGYVWTQHPVDPSLLLCVSSQAVQIYNWDTLTLVSPTAGISTLQLEIGQVSDGDPAQLSVHSATTLFAGSQAILAASYSRKGSYGFNKRGNGSKTWCFPASAFSTQDGGSAEPVEALLDDHAIF